MIAHGGPEAILPRDEVILDAFGEVSLEYGSHCWLHHHHLLGIIVAQSQFKDPVGAQLLQSLVHIDGHLVVVLIGLVAQAKDLESDKSEFSNYRMELTT